MTEPVNRWEPATDEYKAKQVSAADIETELQEKLRDLHESNVHKPQKQEMAPLGIRIFTWYYFGRAGLCALLLIVLAGFPHSAPSTWLSDGISSFLHLPGSKSEREARSKEIEREAQAYAVPENAIADEEPDEASPETLRNMVLVYLLFSLAAGAVIGFMWWNRSWKIRWITMFYSGALIAKVLINFIAGAASGVGSEIAPRQMPLLLVTLVFNSLIFLYLAFGYGVEQWFERGV